jgi:hypothetical protein
VPVLPKKFVCEKKNAAWWKPAAFFVSACLNYSEKARKGFFKALRIGKSIGAFPGSDTK